jgi:hypothetical protein
MSKTYFMSNSLVTEGEERAGQSTDNDNRGFHSEHGAIFVVQSLMFDNSKLYGLIAEENEDHCERHDRRVTVVSKITYQRLVAAATGRLAAGVRVAAGFNVLV